MATDYMLDEILEQPVLFGRLIAAPVVSPVAERLCFTGSGDSHCAAEIAAWAWRRRGCDAIAIRPLELARYRAARLGPGTTLVAISASGRTRRVLEAIHVAHARGAQVVAITDDPSSMIAEAADVVWPLGASPSGALATTEYDEGGEAARYVGYHHDVPQTKTFTASIAAAVLPSGAVADRLVECAAESLDIAAKSAAAIGATLAAAERTVFVGSDGLRPVARYGAYKMCEFVRVGFAQEAEEYCHTHYFITDSRTAVVFMVDDALSRERAGEIAPVVADELGATVHTIDIGGARGSSSARLVLPDPGDEAWRPVIASLAVQRITHAMARAAGLSTSTFRGGLDPERYVAGSARAIRGSRIVPPEELHSES